MNNVVEQLKPSIWEQAARLVLAAIYACRKRLSFVTWVAIFLILLTGTWYLAATALGVAPLGSTVTVKVRLAQSGGLLPNQDVTLRGVPVGRIESISAEGKGVIAIAALDRKVKIPASSMVQVSGLSAAGEQYLDFRPQTRFGPYLVDGSVIDEQQTSLPVSLAQMLTDSDGVLAQIDPPKLHAIAQELGVTQAGPEKLTAILDGSMFLLSTLDSVLPETVSVLKNSRTVLTTLGDASPGAAATASSLHRALTGISAMDGGYRTLLSTAPTTLTAVDALIEDNSGTMVQLLGNLAIAAPLSYVRVPALNALFTSARGSAVEAAASVIRDGGVWVAGDVYPRYSCDYATPRDAPSNADHPLPYLYTTYCANRDPAVLIRGARNAPRPIGDDTAEPPAGADPLRRADPIPQGRYTIPTPYGGPQLPIDPPPPPGGAPPPPPN